MAGSTIWLRTPEAREQQQAGSGEGKGLVANTVRKRIGNAKQFFEDAVSRELLNRNPFANLKGSVGSNRERDYFLSREDAARITEACPDHEWRLIFALSRYSGLRCPSEHLALRWSDINWARGTMIVRSSKTARYEGKGSRTIPIFPELRAALNESWEQSQPGDDRVITRYSGAGKNLRTTFQKIVRRAGLDPWPKLFQNLRASRATELANEHSAHVSAAWLGHSTAIAAKHYWQVTEADFEKARAEVDPSGAKAKKSETPEAQQAHAGSRMASQASPPAQKKTPGNVRFPEVFHDFQWAILDSNQ